MSGKFGTLLFSKNSWGRKDLFTTFGFEGASKTTLNPVDAGKELLTHMSEQQGWVHLKDALNELVVFSEEGSPTESYNVTVGRLTALWNKQSAIMRDETPNELSYYQSVVSGIKADFDSIPTVGCNKLKESVIKHALNLFETI